MLKVLHVVVDTNVIVSGSFGLKNSPSLQILQAIRSQKIILITSGPIINELKEVIARERITKITKFSKLDQNFFIDGLIKRANVVVGKSIIKSISRDAKDDKYLACALEAKADYIITGDKDLLVLEKIKQTKIVTPRQFVDILNKL